MPSSCCSTHGDHRGSVETFHPSHQMLESARRSMLREGRAENRGGSDRPGADAQGDASASTSVLLTAGLTKEGGPRDRSSARVLRSHRRAVSCRCRPAQRRTRRPASAESLRPRAQSHMSSRSRSRSTKGSAPSSSGGSDPRGCEGHRDSGEAYRGQRPGLPSAPIRAEMDAEAPQVTVVGDQPKGTDIRSADKRATGWSSSR